MQMKRIIKTLALTILITTATLVLIYVVILYVGMSISKDRADWQENMSLNGPWGEQAIWKSSESDMYLICEYNDSDNSEMVSVAAFIQRGDTWVQASFNTRSGTKRCYVDSLDGEALLDGELRLENDLLTISDINRYKDDILEKKEKIILKKYDYNSLIMFYDSKITEKKERLMETGAPESYINSLPEREINRLYSSFKDKYIKFVGSKTEVFNVGKHFGDNEAATYGIISETELKLKIYYFEEVSDLVLPNSEVYGLIVETEFEWLNVPTYRMEDGMTLNWDGSIFNMDGFYCSSGYLVNDEWNELEHSNVAATVATGGVGWYSRISTPPTGYIYPVIGFAEIHLVPVESFVVKDRPNMQINFNYAHQKIGASISFGVSLDSGSLGVSQGVNFSGGNYDSQGIAAIYNDYEYPEE